VIGECQQPAGTGTPVAISCQSLKAAFLVSFQLYVVIYGLLTGNGEAAGNHQ
jgi:hypothetical protein